MTVATVKAGYCTTCGTKTWRMCVAQRNDLRSGIVAGTEYILWPNPTSRYVQLQTENGYASGVGYCDRCCPDVGEIALVGYGPVIKIDFARERYHAWYKREREEFYKAWLADAMSLETETINRLLEQWEADRG